MSKVEVKIGGFGGQGVILSAYIIGRAATLFEKKQATMTQAFGPAARGSACSAQIIISDVPILYPYVTKPDILVIMSQDAYNQYSPQITENGTLIIEEDLVKVGEIKKGLKTYFCPATKLAEELQARIAANVVMVGFFTAVTGLISKDSMMESVKRSVPERALEVNLKAFQKGYEYGKSHY